MTGLEHLSDKELSDAQVQVREFLDDDRHITEIYMLARVGIAMLPSVHGADEFLKVLAKAILLQAEIRRRELAKLEASMKDPE